MVINVNSLPLTSGAAPVVLDVLALAALIWLLVGPRRHLQRAVPIAVASTFALTVGLWFVSELLWNLWGAPLPLAVYCFIAIGILAMILVIPKVMVQRSLWVRISTPVVAAVVVLASASLVNQDFQYYPTLGSLFEDSGVAIESLAQLKLQQPSAVRMSPTPTREATWTPPADMPRDGVVIRTSIPATISHLPEAPGYVYLPPAFLGSPRANLPVLVLIHGVPGGSFDWLRGPQIAQFMNGYAQDHKGLAPVVVMPDAGAINAKYPPLCLDSRQGKGATYLTQDVPNWIKKTFGAGTYSPGQWAIGGFSYGGTCAMQLATNYPNVYPTFIDSSGENEPTINQGRSELVRAYFGGNEAAFAKQNALDVLKTRRYTTSAGVVTVGASDSFYRPQGIEVYEAMKQAGMDVQLQEAPGGHAWPAWKYGVYNNMDWLMGRLTAGTGRPLVAPKPQPATGTWRAGTTTPGWKRPSGPLVRSTASHAAGHRRGSGVERIA
ncbi:S-formylglutathione hydrolase FrmB [Arthrobacter oryzae]|uniref:S-formylglutathione hydrolase FrmB n=1 Tax=Arthrobacter oryzae TaxID=409290 RepID=A0A495FMQ1_9MICC|nr:S-formylglutathione hydrolase FrmB [Arthrobacter oryzae]